MWFVGGVEFLIFGDDLIVVLALAVADVVVWQQLIGEVVVVDDFDHDPAEDDQDTQPLHFSQMVTVPGYVDADS